MTKCYHFSSRVQNQWVDWLFLRLLLFYIRLPSTKGGIATDVPAGVSKREEDWDSFLRTVERIILGVAQQSTTLHNKQNSNSVQKNNPEKRPFTMKNYP